MVCRSLVFLGFFGILISQIFLNNSFADPNYFSEFNRLKEKNSNYQVYGKICEDVAQIRLEDLYPSPRYQVLTGLIYANSRGQVLGEMDEVVFDSYDHSSVVFIGEVKCNIYRNLKKALREARQQQDRLFASLRSKRDLRIYDPITGVEYNPEQFLSLQRNEYKTMSHDEGVPAGFDMGIGMTLYEVMSLRAALMEYQSETSPFIPSMRPRRKSWPAEEFQYPRKVQKRLLRRASSLR